MKYYNPKYQDGIEFNYTTNVFKQVKVSLVYQLNEDGDFDIIKETIDWDSLLDFVENNSDSIYHNLEDELIDKLDYYIDEYIYENFSD